MEVKDRKMLALDFGGSSGRAVLGYYDGCTIEIEEIYRFENEPVSINGVLYWDILRLFCEIKKSIVKAKEYGTIASIGIDTWGVDFALLDNRDRLLQNPVHYRDSRTRGMIEKCDGYLPAKELYLATGNQIMEMNTLFQLLSLKETEDYLLQYADSLLLLPDFFSYLLTGKKVSERSIASTTQLFDMVHQQWSDTVIQKLGLPAHIFQDIVPSGTVIGPLSGDICEELKTGAADVIAVAGHDTQSALVGVPAREKDFLFISSGTWSLMGTELDAPIINEKTYEYNLTNELGVGNKVSLLKNITGLWLIQETRRQWIKEGNVYAFSELEKRAESAEPLKCFIDTDDPVFQEPGDMPKRIQKYCMNTGQPVPSNEAEIIRCIDESLALKYRWAMEQTQDCTGKEYDKIYIVGGGVQSRLLCQMTANACHCGVTAGPVEATVLGNLAVQLMAAGEISNLEEAREMIENSQEQYGYTPQETEEWDEAYDRFLDIIS